MKNLVFLAWNNVVRRRNYTLFTAVTTAIAVGAFVASNMIFLTISDGLALSQERLGADIIVLPHTVSANAQQVIFTANPVNIYMPNNVQEVVASTPGVKSITPQFFAQTLNESCCSLGTAKRLVGFDSNSDFVLQSWVTPRDAVTKLADDEIIVGGAVEPFLGSRALILGSVFKVAGVLERTGTGMDETIFLKMEVARRLVADSPYLQELWRSQSIGTSVSALLLKVDSAADPVEVVESINGRQLGVNAVPASRVIAGVKDQISIIRDLFFWLWLALALVVVTALAGRIDGIVRKRKREIGVLRALGVERKNVVFLLLLETSITSGIGAALGGMIGFGVAWYVLDTVLESLKLPKMQIAVQSVASSEIAGIAIAMVLGLMVAAYPAWRISRLEPQQAIAQGDLD